MYCSNGVGQSYATAVKWYRKAADQGCQQAQYNLGCMYKNGEGVGQSNATAVEWWLKAADKGYADAQCGLGEFNGEMIAMRRHEGFSLDFHKPAFGNY